VTVRKAEPRSGPGGGSRRRLALTGTGALLLLVLAGFLATRLPREGQPAAAGKAAVTSSLPTPAPVVVAFEHRLQRSERMIRVHFKTLPAAALGLASRNDAEGDLLALRHNGQRARLPSDASADGIVLESGPLSVEALRDGPAPAMTGEGFHVLLTRETELANPPPQ
jgi:hypothetical protein